MLTLRRIVLALALLWAAPALAAPVAYTFSGNTASGTGATVSVTIPAGGIPAGSGIYVAALEIESAASVTANGTVADTAATPNSYSELSGGIGNPIQSRTQIFQAYNSNAVTSGQTITYTLFNSGNYAVISVFYVTGLTTTNPYDSATLNTTTFTTTTTPAANQSGTPSVAGELFIAIVGSSGSGTSRGFTLDTSNGWSAPPPTLSGGGISTFISWIVAGGLQSNSGTGRLTSQPTFSSSSDGATIILGLKAAVQTTHCGAFTTTGVGSC